MILTDCKTLETEHRRGLQPSEISGLTAGGQLPYRFLEIRNDPESYGLRPLFKEAEEG
jgi:hypothetical protein